MSEYSNIIRVVSTGYEPSVLWRDILIDVEEFIVLSCDVEKEKGILTYDTNLAARRLTSEAGITLPSTSEDIHIGSMPLVTELELELMEERGVKIIIEKKLKCHRRDIPCDPKKVPAGNCAGCKEFKRRAEELSTAA